MTKRHFYKLAEIVRCGKQYAAGCDQAEKLLRDIAGSLARLSAEENPRFDRDRFLLACGYTYLPEYSLSDRKGKE